MGLAVFQQVLFLIANSLGFIKQNWPGYAVVTNDPQILMASFLVHVHLGQQNLVIRLTVYKVLFLITNQ